MARGNRFPGEEPGREPELLHEADGSMWSSLVSNLRDAFVSSKQPPLQLTSQPTTQDLILREEPIWQSLTSGFRDAFFPTKLPPLVLTSTPIPVKDLLAEERRPLPLILSIATYALLGAVVALLLYEARIHARALGLKSNIAQVDVKPFVPITLKAKPMGGGGGGGDRSPVEVSKGKIPKLALQQVVPPQILRVDHPKIAVEPTIVMPKNIKLPDVNMPNIGLPSSSQTQLASNGTGSGGGMGSGNHGGLGSGNGGGFGPGEGGGTGGGLYQVGSGGVTAPLVIYSVDPEFSDEARRAKYEGIVNVSVIVDAQGNPQHVRVPRALGMGLDEKAIEAVRQYKFKPAMLRGHPVPVEVTIEVNFRIY